VWLCGRFPQADARQFAKEALDAADNREEKDISANIKVRGQGPWRLAPVCAAHPTHPPVHVLLDGTCSCVVWCMRLQRRFDGKYGPAWHCIVGSDFKAAFSHESKNFIFVSIGKMNILLYKAG
jgi:hypothetical protein